MSLLRLAVLKALAFSPMVCDGVLRRLVHVSEYEEVTYLLTKISTARTTVDVAYVQSRENWQVLVGQNVEARAYMLLIKTYMGFATGPQIRLDLEHTSVRRSC